MPRPYAARTARSPSRTAARVTTARVTPSPSRYHRAEPTTPAARIAAQDAASGPVPPLTAYDAHPAPPDIAQNRTIDNGG